MRRADVLLTPCSQTAFAAFVLMMPTSCAASRVCAVRSAPSESSPLPDGLGAGDAVENADWQPEAVFRNNVVRGSTPRAALFTTPGRVRVEGNLFERVAAQAVHLSGDASDWFESGACRDVLVRGNAFRDCLLVGGKGVVQIDPNVPEPAAQRRRYHRNVRIEGNAFEQSRGPLVYARSVSNLVFRANAVRGAGGIDAERCEEVVTGD